MKTWTLLGLASVLALATITRAQDYRIDWWTVDGGGGTSTGGTYSMSGTTGQPDAGQMSGGDYTVSGGFWSILAVVPTPGAPLLTITRTVTNTVVVSWPSPSTGWNLQQNTNLNTSTWVSPPESVTDNGSIKYIIVSPPTGNRFYRLQKP